MPPDLTFYAVQLQKDLHGGEILNLDVLAVFTHSLKPFPEKITQAEVQLVVFQDSAYYLSPYVVKVQSLGVKLPSKNVESFTKFENSKLIDSEIKYGPYENLPAFSYTPIVVHFESSSPFAVAQELLREIEISHWGNIQVTEHYKLVHGGAHNKGGFSRSSPLRVPHPILFGLWVSAVRLSDNIIWLILFLQVWLSIKAFREWIIIIQASSR